MRNLFFCNFSLRCTATLFLYLVSRCAVAQQKSPAEDVTRYVDPFIGTAAHGHVFLGASVPFGGVQLGPTNRTQGWDWCSGYNYADSTVIGFSHTHLSGTGIGDLGDVTLMPVVGRPDLERSRSDHPGTGYYSLFSHGDEKAAPGYYSVFLKRYGIKAELTATERTGFHQYSFPASDSSGIVLDLETGIGWDQATATCIEKVNDSTVKGYRYSKGWAVDQKIFFTARFSRPATSFAVYDGSGRLSNTKGEGKRIRGIAFFSTAKNEKIKVKVGLSPVSADNAEKNLQAEIPDWNFDAVLARAKGAWNKELGKIKFVSRDAGRTKTFYTALYHTLIAPSLFNDVNKAYRGTDGKVYPTASFNNLTTFSLWDTYRAAHPLFTLLQSDRVNDMLNSMLAIYRQQGKLPVWHLMGNETNTMPGYSAVQVIADAYLKGFRGFDTALAWQAVKTTAMQDERGLKYVKRYGYIPADSMVESVAMGLEYSIADAAIAQMAKTMGKSDDYAYFNRRGANYKNYFDATTGFMRGRLAEKEWRTPFSPFTARHMKDDFTEGNAWQYTWLVPQDAKGLIALLGGERPFSKKLDSFFVLKGDMGKEASNDITGLIGQYAHGNEPSHHIAYFYAYTGEPWKTADKTRAVLDSLYTNRKDGLCGNEDVGQMSAWYVLSALGLYQVNPAGGVFVFGSPVMDKATLTLGNGKQLQITANNNSRENKYIQSIVYNGKPYTKSYLLYSDLMAGGRLTLQMGARPSATWGVDLRDRPY